MSSGIGEKDAGRPTYDQVLNELKEFDDDTLKTTPQGPGSSRSSATEIPGQSTPAHQYLKQSEGSSHLSSDISNLRDPEKSLNGEKDAEKGQPTQAPPSNPMDPSSFPDGGLEAWTVVFGGFCALFVSFGWINCIGIFQDYYQEHLLSSYAPSTIAWIPSLESSMMLATAPFCGKIFDSYGPRYLLLAGTILHVFGLMMTSISTSYYQILLAQGICSPIGAGAVFYPAINSTATWFFKKRAYALGIVASGSSLGGVILPIMVERLVTRIGYAWTMRVCAFTILGLCVIANLTIKSRIPPNPKPFKLTDFTSPFKEMPFLLTTIASWLFFWGIFLPFTFIISTGRAYGMSPNLTGYVIPIVNAASIFGRTLPSYIADRLGRFNTMIITGYLSAILVLAVWLPARGTVPILIFGGLYGFTSGTFVSLGPALIAQISDVRQIGVRTGSMFFFTSLASLTGNPIGGALVGNISQPTFWKMQVFSGVVMLAGSTFFVLARIKLGGMQLKKRF
ncbi:hypothetical protein FQN52_003203 [Onygenales sp. PD_12]|nr:hypothetical protein FQN52_003203 [Onygenales sp. PD_12]